ncbi:20839_t:CDS:2 [Dentiscutata erythropus]|uniref:20839_t:CDS:1 n=1 Tax=Dentiscutata erythropus TaxID=1348616 RepID=A0A9N9EMF8_9GLOM|nr:20839_t:CDS:2 [Dentiscutata erythropus]
MGFSPYSASRELLAAFLAWLEASSRVAEILICLAAVARKYKL